jgi:hypothetical protein
MDTKMAKLACYGSLAAGILNGISLLTGMMAHLPKDILLMRVFATAAFFFSYWIWKGKMEKSQ